MSVCLRFRCWACRKRQPCTLNGRQNIYMRQSPSCRMVFLCRRCAVASDARLDAEKFSQQFRWEKTKKVEGQSAN